jgi:hypothetical protein
MAVIQKLKFFVDRLHICTKGLCSPIRLRSTLLFATSKANAVPKILPLESLSRYSQHCQEETSVAWLNLDDRHRVCFFGGYSIHSIYVETRMLLTYAVSCRVVYCARTALCQAYRSTRPSNNIAIHTHLIHAALTHPQPHSDTANSPLIFLRQSHRWHREPEHVSVLRSHRRGHTTWQLPTFQTTIEQRHVSLGSSVQRTE